MTSLRLLAGLLGILVLSTRAFAQETWAAVTSPTTQDLWGVTWGGGQFVAVGQGGTILTSPDGTAWTARNGGTTAWLLAVTYSATAKLYVIVGDNGTILTSADAITWTARASGTTERLNGIATGNGMFVAVGEHATVSSSADANTWTTQSLGSAMWLRGVAYAGGRFITGGGSYVTTDSAFAYTSTDGRTFQSQPSPWSEGAESISTDGQRVLVAGGHYAFTASVGDLATWQQIYHAALPAGFVVLPFEDAYPPYLRAGMIFNGTWCGAGEAGKILDQSIDGGTPLNRFNAINSLVPSVDFTAAAANDSVAVFVGTLGKIYRSEAVQSAPVVQWSEPKLVSSANVGDSVTLHAGATGGGTMSYQWYLNDQAIPGATSVPLVLANVRPGQTGAYTLKAVNSLGQSTSTAHFLTVVSPLTVPDIVDPTFHPVVNLGLMYEEADGSVLGTSSDGLVRLTSTGAIDPAFTRFPGTILQFVETSDGNILVLYQATSDARAAAFLVRLNHDGSMDHTFTVPTDLLAATYQSVRFVPLSDGRVIVATLATNQLTFRRLAADGTIDTTYGTDTVVAAPPPTAFWDHGYTWITTATAPNGAFLVAASSASSGGTGNFGYNRSFLIRFHADGTRDTDFGPINHDYFIEQLACPNQYIYYFGGTIVGFGDFAARNGRLLADGTEDSTYAGVGESAGSVQGPVTILQPDGSLVWLNDRYEIAADTDNPLRRQLRLYSPSGVWDPQLRAVIPAGTTVDSLVAGRNGHFFASGQFPSLNPSDPSHPASFVRLLVDTATAKTRLINLSVRQSLANSTDVLTLGFSIEGDGHRQMLVRGVGPTLGSFGISDAVSDPTLLLRTLSGQAQLANDDWGQFSDPAALSAAMSHTGAFGLRAGSTDAAGVADLPSGAYTVQVQSKVVGGVALAEVYDTEGEPADYSAPRVVNFSARANTAGGAGVLTAGFTINGPGVKRVLIRGVGPGLRPFGVTGYIADPVLTIYRGTTIVAWNDQATYSSAAGAFPIDPVYDAALVLTLPAGVYSAQVSSADGGAGVALVEVYELRD